MNAFIRIIYQQAWNEYLKTAKYINKQYLNIDDIDNTKKINLCQSSTGTGKTTNAINYTKAEQEKNPNIIYNTFKNHCRRPL